MSSLNRMLAILDLFVGDRRAWTAEGIAEALGYTQATVYRYVRELGDAGLLRGDSGATFVLGPRIIELDYQLRTGDPLIGAARSAMGRLAAATGCDVVLATEYAGHIVTIHHELGAEPISASYSRGRRMPVFRGATSLGLLSALPRQRLRKLHEMAQDAPPWDGLLELIKKIRRDGYALTIGELDPDLVGIAVALTSPAHKVVASLGFIMSTQRHSLVDVAQSVARLQACAQEILAGLGQPTAG
ncbi:DNA-binding IclR family transcriptional regulator [Variovorax boronicumulans]|uniref:IclR family transcriptional regulator n=1 Tax=Variovorax boronicumulans TaxID=436515 RepID=UPI00339B0670